MLSSTCLLCAFGVILMLSRVSPPRRLERKTSCVGHAISYSSLSYILPAKHTDPSPPRGVNGRRYANLVLCPRALSLRGPTANIHGVRTSFRTCRQKTRTHMRVSHSEPLRSRRSLRDQTERCPLPATVFTLLSRHVLLPSSGWR